MTFLAIFAAALLAALCLLNLLLTVGVIRRLKEHTELIQNMPGTGPPPEVMLPAGERVGEFAAETEDGVRVARGELTAETLVGVFSPGCGACAEQMPEFIERAGGNARGRDAVLAVVVGDREEYAAQIERLSAVARVVVENPGGEVSAALGVQGFPAFARLDASGRILASGYQAAELAERAGV